VTLEIEEGSNRNTSLYNHTHKVNYQEIPRLDHVQNMIIEDEEDKTQSVTPDSCSKGETKEIELGISFSDEETQDYKEREK